MTRLTLTEAHELAAAILRHAGFSEAFAQAIAATVTAGERDGCTSHGLWRLLGIVHTLKAGKAVADAEPEVIDQAPSPRCGRRWRRSPSWAW
jgi:LDH2 family malate/lactate/ureidoglycolate dehydrogenase